MKRLVVVMTLTHYRGSAGSRGDRGACSGLSSALLTRAAARSPQAPICTSKAPSAGKQQQFSSPGGCGAGDLRGSGQQGGKVERMKALKCLPQPTDRKKAKPRFPPSTPWRRFGGVRSPAPGPRLWPTDRALGLRPRLGGCRSPGRPTPRIPAAALGGGPRPARRVRGARAGS